MFAWYFFVACLVSIALTKPAIYLARRFNLVTKENRKHPAHTHTGIIPRAGGVPILLSIIICSSFFIPYDPVIFGIIATSIGMVIVGLLDDYYDISAYVRFIANIFIISFAVCYGLTIPFISNPFGGVINLNIFTYAFFSFKTFYIFGDIIALIWLVWTTNSINWSKGVDGQMSGFVAVAAVFIGLFADKTAIHSVEYNSVVALCMIVAGSFLGFTYFNFYPQFIMPGYSAGSLAGFLLGALSIISFAKIGSLMFILAIPTIDAIYTIVRRIASKKSPFLGDRGHFHHRLLDLGWGRRRIAVFYWLVTFMMGISGLYFHGLQKLFAFFGIMILVLLFIILIEHVKVTRKLSV